MDIAQYMVLSISVLVLTGVIYAWSIYNKNSMKDFKSKKAKLAVSFVGAIFFVFILMQEEHQDMQSAGRATLQWLQRNTGKNISGFNSDGSRGFTLMSENKDQL